MSESLFLYPTTAERAHQSCIRRGYVPTRNAGLTLELIMVKLAWDDQSAPLESNYRLTKCGERE